MNLDHTGVWLLVLAIAVITVLIKAVGPLALGGRALPAWAAGIIALMPGALLAALVVTVALSEGRDYHVDASTAGVAVAGVLVWRRAPLLLAVLVAVAVTAALRAVW